MLKDLRKKCVGMFCNKKATWRLDGLCFCTYHKEFYANDFKEMGKPVKIAKKK